MPNALPRDKARCCIRAIDLYFTPKAPKPVTMPDAITLSVDQLNTLLRMYLAWPKHVGESPDEEANEFYLWLSTELHEDELVDITGGLDGVKHFIKANGGHDACGKVPEGPAISKGK